MKDKPVVQFFPERVSLENMHKLLSTRFGITSHPEVEVLINSDGSVTVCNFSDITLKEKQTVVIPPGPVTITVCGDSTRIEYLGKEI